MHNLSDIISCRLYGGIMAATRYSLANDTWRSTYTNVRTLWLVCYAVCSHSTTVTLAVSSQLLSSSSSSSSSSTYHQDLDMFGTLPPPRPRVVTARPATDTVL